jgi:hypothetical protein
MESFFKSFKTEEVYQNSYQTHEEITRATTDYIERFYNRKRLHSALGYQSPIECERTLTKIVGHDDDDVRFFAGTSSAAEKQNEMAYGQKERANHASHHGGYRPFQV